MCSVHTEDYYLVAMQLHGEALIPGSISWAEKNQPTNPNEARITTATKFTALTPHGGRGCLYKVGPVTLILDGTETWKVPPLTPQELLAIMITEGSVIFFSPGKLPM